MRTSEDQLNMRELYEEGDLISAEIQNISAEGVVSLHTRSMKYGKLENGQLIIVPSHCIKRLSQHYCSLPIGIDVILGRNGYIWITRSIPDEWKAQDEDADDMTPLAETLQRLKIRHAQTLMLLNEREKIARIRNAIDILASNPINGGSSGCIYPESILAIYRKSEQLELTIKDMLRPDVIQQLI
jgi:exosome complex component RRP4